MVRPGELLVIQRGIKFKVCIYLDWNARARNFWAHDLGAYFRSLGPGELNRFSILHFCVSRV